MQLTRKMVKLLALLRLLLLYGNLLLLPAMAQDSQVSTLLLIRDALSGGTQTQLNDWLSTDESPCSWTGVTCTNKSSSTGGVTRVVTGLDLSSKNLSGYIPNEIGMLTDLAMLDLNSNSLIGDIPAGITNLSALWYLNLTTNCLNGTVPAGMSAMRSMQKLDLYDNFLTDILPDEVAQLPELVYLHLGGNNFHGGIPSTYWNMTKIEFLSLAGNQLTGVIPPDVGNLTSIVNLELGYNLLESELPPELAKLRNIIYLDISMASIYGGIPRELGQLSQIVTLFLFNNRLSGPLPPEIGNLTSIQSLDLSNNTLTGTIPLQLANLREARLLSLWLNNFTGTIPTGFGDLTKLQTLLLWNNTLTGSLPQQLGQNSSLGWLDVSTNQLTGTIPPDLCKAGALFRLILFNNAFTGTLPSGLASCESLYRVRIQNNRLSGPIPPGFGFLPALGYLDMSRNLFAGDMPHDIVSATQLTFVDMSFNHISGDFPSSDSVWTFYNLQEFHITNNNLSGIIPAQFGNVSVLGVLDLSGNFLTGFIPEALCNCSKLVSLNLSNNRLSGEIPPLFGQMMDLASLDISRNEFTGPIPSSLQNLSTLDSFNVSFNQLSGPIPSGGVFQFFNSSSFVGNPHLCGLKALRPCTRVAKNKKHSGPLAFMVAGIFLVAMGVLIVGVCCFYKQYRWQICRALSGSVPNEWPWTLTTFQRLNFTASDVVECLKENNIIGMGGAGTVYKGEFPGGDSVAVKRLWGSRKPEVNLGKDQGFSAEVDLLGSIRHRNIVKLLGFCSNHETNLLVYEYMPNGSLGELLHGWKNGSKRDGKKVNILADWLTRFNIAMGVAQGLAYLHHDCSPPIVHRDVKSNNILLDSNMEARVADFGLAKLFECNQSMSLVAGSYGYIAPEYAYTLKVDEKSDIYSFGVVLLELLTGRQPVEASEFGDSVNIVEWVNRKIPSKEGLLDVLDPDVGSGCYSVQEEMILVLRIAILCTSRVPRERPSMRDVVTMLSEAQPRRKTLHNEPSFRARFL